MCLRLIPGLFEIVDGENKLIVVYTPVDPSKSVIEILILDEDVDTVWEGTDFLKTVITEPRTFHLI